MKPLKITACLLVLLQAFHLARPQTTADSLGRTIDPSWLRQPLKQAGPYENTANPEENEFDVGTDASESSVEYSSGITSGLMPGNTEDENVPTEEKSENETYDDSNISNKTMPSVVGNEATKRLEVPGVIVPPANETISSSQTNTTEGEEVFNSTATAENFTTVLDFANTSTTVAPESKTMGPPETTSGKELDRGLANRTGTMDRPGTTTAPPETAKTTAGNSSTTGFFSETTAVPNTPDRVNKTGKGGIFSERDSLGESDLQSKPYRSNRNVAWLFVLGVAAVAACAGVVAYILLRKKQQKGFTHRKLVEEYPSDPVLRLDNCEPLDLNFGSSAYHNPGLQGDSIQMTDIPGRR